jgi:hypothetical protein
MMGVWTYIKSGRKMLLKYQTQCWAKESCPLLTIFMLSAGSIKAPFPKVFVIAVDRGAISSRESAHRKKLQWFSRFTWALQD